MERTNPDRIILVKGISMSSYYSEKLSAQRLKQCYDIAPPRTKQYLQAEIDHIQKYIKPHHSVLELGCGYGRVLSSLNDKCSYLFGIDISQESLHLARTLLNTSSTALVQMNAKSLGFSDQSFDVVICIQNGISAFQLPPALLLREAVRVTVPGGVCLFSSYSEDFWESRLEWFKVQSEAGLIGPIDWDLSVEGTIVCTDGFKAKTFTQSDFMRVVQQISLKASFHEVDESSLFCEVLVPKHSR